MGPDHHVSYDGGQVDPLGVEDDIDEVSSVIYQTTSIGGRKDVVCEDVVEDLGYRPIVLVCQSLRPVDKPST